VFYFMASAALLLAIIAGVESVRSASPPHQDTTFEILAPQAGPLAHDSLGSSDENGE
jgi:hypothetical protein